MTKGIRSDIDGGVLSSAEEYTTAPTQRLPLRHILTSKKTREPTRSSFRRLTTAQRSCGANSAKSRILRFARTRQ